MAAFTFVVITVSSMYPPVPSDLPVEAHPIMSAAMAAMAK
jgi:hypothetical protein